MGVRLKEPLSTLGATGDQQMLAQPMHSSVTGSALRRSVVIGRRHERQRPNVPAATRASARSTSTRCASTCPRRAAVRSRSNAIVAPSGSCSSSQLVFQRRGDDAFELSGQGTKTVHHLLSFQLQHHGRRPGCDHAVRVLACPPAARSRVLVPTWADKAPDATVADR